METLLTPVAYSPQDQYATEIDKLCRLMGKKDFCFIPGDRLKSILQRHDTASLIDFQAFQDSWSRLALDEYMADGGKYRKRRHATLSAAAGSKNVHVESHQPHFQSLTYNTLNGGVARHYQPIEHNVLQGKTMQNIIQLGCNLFGKLSPYSNWHIEAHQFRIDPQGGEVGKPTPEGVHRDGVSFVMMLIVKRTNIVNGSTTIYDLEKRRLDEFTLTNTLDLAIVNDERILHGVTPIIQLDTDRSAHRDVLVVTFRHKQN